MDFGSLLQTGGAGLSNLLQNRLFLQYLSGAGAALSTGQPVGPVVHGITQKTIAAQSQAELNKRYMDMLGKMLSGEEVPTGGKVVHSETGTKIDVPKGMGAVGVPTAPTVPGTPGALAGPPTMGQAGLPPMGQVGTINPFEFGQLDISAADLAGLGPQDVSRALAGATDVEVLRQQSIARLVGARAREPLEEDYPIPHPEAGIMSLRQWGSLPAEEKEFAAYVHAAKKLGAPREELTRRFFSTLEPTEREQFARAAMKDPELMAATKELARAGATRITIGEKVAEKKALGRLRGQLYFSDPKWIDDISKHLGSGDIQRRIFMESQKEGADLGLIKAEETVKYIEDKISAGKGTIQDVKLSEDGRTMIWTIEWPSGDVEDIRYAVRS